MSAAAGAVGSVAAQIAKIKGARVVGIAGGPEKCALLTEHLGLDAAVDHRASDWHDQLVAATPDGIDVDFENVGGEIMDAVFARINLRARVVLCGLISGYNEAEPPPGPRSFSNLLVQRARLEGFIVLDHLDRIGEAVAELAAGSRRASSIRSRPSSRASSSSRPRSTCCSTAPTSASCSCTSPTRKAPRLNRTRLTHIGHGRGAWADYPGR